MIQQLIPDKVTVSNSIGSSWSVSISCWHGSVHFLMTKRTALVTFVTSVLSRLLFCTYFSFNVSISKEETGFWKCCNKWRHRLLRKKQSPETASLNEPRGHCLVQFTSFRWVNLSIWSSLTQKELAHTDLLWVGAVFTFFQLWTHIWVLFMGRLTWKCKLSCEVSSCVVQ